MKIDTVINGSGIKEHFVDDNHGRPLKIITNDNDVLINIEDKNSTVNRRFSRLEFDELVRAVNA